MAKKPTEKELLETTELKIFIKDENPTYTFTGTPTTLAAAFLTILASEKDLDKNPFRAAFTIAMLYLRDEEPSLLDLDKITKTTPNERSKKKG